MHSSYFHILRFREIFSHDYNKIISDFVGRYVPETNG